MYDTELKSLRNEYETQHSRVDTILMFIASNKLSTGREGITVRYIIDLAFAAGVSAHFRLSRGHARPTLNNRDCFGRTRDEVCVGDKI